MKKKSRGVSLTELLIGLIVGSVIFAGVYKMMTSMSRSSTLAITTGKMDEDLSRFATIMTNDLSKAGSDPTGNALLAYILQATCGGKIILKYGINPDPADAACTNPLGLIGILSYLPYDANGDGTVDPEEGLDMTTNPPALRTPLAGKDYPSDYVAYAFVDTDGDGAADAIERRIIDNTSTKQTALAKVVLKNVVSFTINYYGFDQTGTYGQVTNATRYDDIREVEVIAMVRGTVADPKYNNPLLPSTSPWYHYPTRQFSFRTSLIVRKA